MWTVRKETSSVPEMRTSSGRITVVKKAHKVKNNVIATEKGQVLYLSRTYEGRIHDKAIVDEEGWQLPEGLRVHVDLDFKGLKAEGGTIEMPHKNLEPAS